jgi:tetratricopeptide (TPR) repeat protein
LFEVGTVLLTYQIAKQFSGSIGALFAAWVLAVNPLLIKESHLVNVDTPLTFFVMLSVYYSIRLLTHPTRKNFVFVGVVIGLATATKYTGALLLSLLLGVHLLRSQSIKEAFLPSRVFSVLLSTVVACFTFAIFNPYIFFDYQNFLVDFSFEQSHMASGHFGLSQDANAIEFYLWNSLHDSIGWVLGILLVVSLFLIVYKAEKKSILLLVFPILYGAIILSWKMRADRYILPLVPFFIVFASIGFSSLVQHLSNQLDRYSKLQRTFVLRRPAIAVMLALLVSVESVYASLEYQRSYTLPDTRALAKEWITKNLPANSYVAMAPLGINLPPGYIEVPIPYTFIEFDRYAPFYDARWYRDCDLVVGSTFDYSRLMQEPDKYAEFLTYFYDSLRTNYQLSSEIEPVGSQMGPRIWLYQPRVANKDSLFPASLLERLDLIRSHELLRIFSQGIASALYAKGLKLKSNQLLYKAALVDSSLTHVEIASRLYDEGKFIEALPEIENALTFSPNDASLNVLRGQTLLELDRAEEARDAFEMGISLGDQTEDTYVGLAIAYYKEREKQKGIEILENYLKTLKPGTDQSNSVTQKLNELRSLP